MLRFRLGMKTKKAWFELVKKSKYAPQFTLSESKGLTNPGIRHSVLAFRQVSDILYTGTERPADDSFFHTNSNGGEYG